jgi:hypothetical protein
MGHKFKKGEVIHIEWDHPNTMHTGLYAVIEQREWELRLCRIDGIGNLETFDDGKVIMSGTGADHPGITRTDLSVDPEKLKT